MFQCTPNLKYKGVQERGNKGCDKEGNPLIKARAVVHIRGPKPCVLYQAYDKHVYNFILLDQKANYYYLFHHISRQLMKNGVNLTNISMSAKGLQWQPGEKAGVSYSAKPAIHSQRWKSPRSWQKSRQNITEGRKKSGMNYIIR